MIEKISVPVKKLDDLQIPFMDMEIYVWRNQETGKKKAGFSVNPTGMYLREYDENEKVSAIYEIRHEKLGNCIFNQFSGANDEHASQEEMA